MIPSKGDVIQFKPRGSYVSGDRYEVHKVVGDWVYFHTEEPDGYGYGQATIDRWNEMKAQANAA